MAVSGVNSKRSIHRESRVFGAWLFAAVLLFAALLTPLFAADPARTPPAVPPTPTAPTPPVPTPPAPTPPVKTPPATPPPLTTLPIPPPPTRLPATTSDLATKLRQRGDLTLTDTTLRQALFTISESWQVNLVVGEEVNGHVNGVFKDAPLHEILHSILYANGFGYQIVGEGLVVMKMDSLGDSNPLFATEAIVLRSIKPEDIVESASLLRSPQGKIKAIPSAHSLMVVDFPERIKVIRQFVMEVDKSAGGGTGEIGPNMQRQVAQFTPQFVKVETLKESLDSVLSKDGKAVVIEQENRVVVVDYPGNLEMAARMMRDLDQARPQVRITALIYDVSLEDLERLGINWNHAIKGNEVNAQGNPDAMWAIDSLTTVPASSGTPAAAMTFMNLSRNFDITATINALCESKDAQLLADPSVTVVDREPATIQIVTEIPYQQLTQTQQGGQIGTTAFREAGVTLKVIPHIAADGTVQMEVTPTFSRLTGFTNGQNPQPIIDKREAKTTVRVINQQWLVIGGLRQRTAIKNDRGVPKLDQIKYINKLFSSFDYNFRESELIVFIRPESVTPAYGGREREKVVLGAAENWLDETPVAPQVLGQGQVGCVNCGKTNCAGCRLRRQQDAAGECDQPSADAPSSKNPPEEISPRVTVLPANTRRLPGVNAYPPAASNSSRAANTPTPAERPTTASPAAKQAIVKPKPKNEAASKAMGRKSDSQKVAMKDTKSSKPVAKAADKGSGSWLGSWW